MHLTADRVLSLVLSALIAVATPSLLLGSQGVRQLLDLRQQRARLRTATVVQARDNDVLRATIHKLKSDPQYLEGLARQELGLVRAGETVYRFSASGDRR